MPRLEVPPLTFSTNDKGVEYLTKEQVTTLIDKLQQSHSSVVVEALKGPQSEVTKLETALREAQKSGEKLKEVETNYATLQARVERQEVAQSLLGLFDPEQAEELHAIYNSRTGAMDPATRPTFKAWAEDGIADPSKTPALTRHLFEAAAAVRAEGGTGGTGGTGGGTGGTGGGTGGTGGTGGGTGGTGGTGGGGAGVRPPAVAPPRQTGGPGRRITAQDIAAAGGDKKKLGEAYAQWKKETGRA
jgi:hypothetical protein